MSKAAPAAPDGLVWETLPTFDQLKERSGVKVSKLRLLLSGVPRWKCPDNTVRYDDAAATEALAEASAELGDDLADDDDEKKLIDAAKTEGVNGVLMLLFNKALGLLSSAQREKNETIKAMGEPLRVGVELLQKAAADLGKRTGELEENRDKVFKLIEEALTARTEREIATLREQANIKMRGQVVDVLKEQVPSIVQKWGLTSQATMALDLIGSLDPRVIDGVLASGVLDEKQTAMLQQLRTSLASKQNGAASSAASSEPPKEENTNGEQSHDDVQSKSADATGASSSQGSAGKTER